MSTRPFYPRIILQRIPQLLPYLLVTLEIVVMTVLIGSLLGFILARARIKGGRVSGFLAAGYLYLLRCTPPIVLLFMVYYGLPKFLLEGFGVDINGFHKGFFVIITFSLLFASSMSEVMRSAYEAIDKGQYEAAVSVGMTGFQACRRIVFPQATVVALPNFVNALISLLKEGSLAYTIGMIDLMGKGSLLISNNYGAYALETYLALAVIYWSVTLLIEHVFSHLEQNLSKGRRKIEMT